MGHEFAAGHHFLVPVSEVVVQLVGIEPMYNEETLLVNEKRDLSWCRNIVLFEETVFVRECACVVVEPNAMFFCRKPVARASENGYRNDGSVSFSIFECL